MIGCIFILVAVGVGAWIIKERRMEKLEDAFINSSAAYMDEEDDEDLWYTWANDSACELCDDVVTEDEAIVGVTDQDGNLLIFCEFCLNPDLSE